jgi:hypothetical protein
MGLPFSLDIKHGSIYGKIKLNRKLRMDKK